MKRVVIWTSLSVLCLAGVGADVGTAQERVLPWADAIDAIKHRSDLIGAADSLIAAARKEVEAGLVRRPHRLEEVGKYRTWLDGRSEVLEEEIRETFALAMSDFAACNHLAGALPTVAAAARLTGDPQLRRHVIAQLREMSTWQPLQRPWWTLYKPGHRLGADGKDGNWLATGCGARAIITTLDILGEQANPELRAKFDKLFAAEIKGVVDDWKTKRPWFVRTNNAITNQWVLPTEGLVRACLHLGVDEHRDAYELGVGNLLQALSAHGMEGEFEEGIGYAAFTMTAMFHTARAMAEAGDRRAIDHPFLARYPTWAVHHIQPGRMTVNCFDAGNASIPRAHGGWRSTMSLLVFTGQSEVANWALWEQFDGPTDDLIGLVARVAGKRLQRSAPEAFKAYERAPMVVWRNGWQDDANGVWIRGGHPLDGHDHQDRGHVNYIATGKPILIEAGTPSYSNPDMGVHYASGAGHNVLQIGTFFPKRPYPVQSSARIEGWQQPGGIAPITVKHLDANGGSVIVDIDNCYPEVEQWVRHATWDNTGLMVRDEVKLSENKSDIVLFRWHLGTENPVEVTGAGQTFQVRWPDATMTIEADTPLELQQSPAPDSTLTGKQDNQHVCVQVRSRSPVHAIQITTKIKPVVRKQECSDPFPQ